METDAFFDNLKNHKFFYFNEKVPLISVYDDFFYSRNDYDHLSPKQRNLIQYFMVSNDFKRKLRGKYTHKNFEVAVLKPTSLGASPLREINIAVQNSDLVFVSPLGFLLWSIENNVSLDILEQLVTKTPVNLPQAKDFAYHENFYENLCKIYPKFKKLQDDNVEKHKFKRL